MTRSDFLPLPGDLVGQWGSWSPGQLCALVARISKRKTQNVVRLTVRVQKPGSGGIATFRPSLVSPRG